MTITHLPPVGLGTTPTAGLLQTSFPNPMGAPAGAQGISFSDRLIEALNGVNEQQLRANQGARDFEAGHTDDLVSVMVEQQISSLGFEMTKQVRNRALTAYRDIMNMPV